MSTEGNLGQAADKTRDSGQVVAEISTAKPDCCFLVIEFIPSLADTLFC